MAVLEIMDDLEITAVPVSMADILAENLITGNL
jgi:hypothetical protein